MEEEPYTTFETHERKRLIDKADTSDSISARRVLGILIFLGLMNGYALQSTLDTGIVTMTNWTDDPRNWSDRCFDLDEEDWNVSYQNYEKEFDWDFDTTHYVLSAFYYGFIVSQVPGGWLATRYGGKHVLGLAIFLTAVLNFVTPVATRISVYFLFAIRVMVGLCEGLTYPAVHAMWGLWSPKWERSKWTTFSYSGAMIGGVITWLMAGILTADRSDGWPWIYYVFGAIACLWFTVWTLMAHSTPQQHPRISRQERKFIRETAGKARRSPTPWGSILTSPSVWAICVCHGCAFWMFYTMFLCMAPFLRTMHNTDVKSTDVLSAFLCLATAIMIIVAGHLADLIRSKGYLSTANTRKAMTTTGLVVPSILLIVCVYVGCQTRVVIGLLVIAVAFFGFVFSGFYVNHLDIAPRFAGVLMGLSSMFGVIPALAVPVFVDRMSDFSHSLSTWQSIFLVNGCVVVFGCVVFNVLATGEELPWALAPSHGETKERRRRIQKVDNWKVDSTDLTSG